MKLKLDLLCEDLALQRLGKMERRKRVTSSKVGRLSYNGDECTIRRPEELDREEIITEKIYGVNNLMACNRLILIHLFFYLPCDSVLIPYKRHLFYIGHSHLYSIFIYSFTNSFLLLSLFYHLRDLRNLLFSFSVLLCFFWHIQPK